jgi:hypothetical protein
MHEPDFWADYANAMELSIEGNRLIAREIADALSELWHRGVTAFDGMVRSLSEHQDLPPV